MIYLRAGFADKCNSNYSIYVTFGYNPNYVTLIKTLKTRIWNNDKKWWEVPYDDYTPLITMLNNYGIQYNAEEFMLSIQQLSEEVEKMQTIQKTEQKIDASVLDTVEFKTKPFQYQLEGIAYGLTHDRFLLADEMGTGKALSLDTKVLTPNGWVLIKDINVGDTLYDEQGNQCFVTAVYNHSLKNMYKVTFSDNTNVICCDEHLWQVYTANDKFRKNNKIRVLTLGEILKDYKTNQFKYYIPICKPINHAKKCLPIHPYVLGALIGDGCLIHEIGFTSVDAYIINKINSLLLPEYHLKKKKNSNIDYILCRKDLSNKFKRNYYKDSLKILELYGKNSHYKFIPKEYLFSDVSDRIAILQGLMDTDGYITKKGSFYFTSCSETLCDDFIELVQSLGGTALKTFKLIKNKFKSWNVCFKLPSEISPVSLPKKAERVLRKHKYEPIRKIVNIEFVDKQPAKCLTVNSQNNLFIIQNHIVTHNTLQSANIARLKRGGKHCLVIVGYKSLLFNWVREIETHTTEKGYVLGQRMMKRAKKLRTGTLQDRLEDLENLDKIEEFFIITDITTLRQCKKEKYTKKNGKEGTNKNFFYADLIEEWCRKGEIGRIILDEAHVFSSYEVDQTQALLRLRSCPYKIAMTGTPIMNRNLDLFPIMTWLGYEQRNYWEFRERYCRLGGFKGKEVIGDKNNPELHNRLSQFMLRRLKEDVLDLPEKIIIDEYLEMDGKQWALYEKYDKLMKAELAQMKGNKNKLLSAIMTLRKITCHPAWVDESCTNSVKYERAMQIVEEAVRNDQKTIIFSCWTTPFEADMECMCLQKLLSRYNPAMIIGATNDRIGQVDKFQTDSSCMVMLGSVKAMGVGITLTAASNVIWLDEPWTAGVKEQGNDRTHRPGQKNNVNIYTLMCKDTKDEGVHKTVYKKGRLADEIVDGVSPDELFNILENY